MQRICSPASPSDTVLRLLTYPWYQFLTSEKCFLTIPFPPSRAFFSANLCQGFFFTSGLFANPISPSPSRPQSNLSPTNPSIFQFFHTCLLKKYVRTVFSSNAIS